MYNTFFSENFIGFINQYLHGSYGMCLLITYNQYMKLLEENIIGVDCVVHLSPVIENNIISRKTCVMSLIAEKWFSWFNILQFARGITKCENCANL